MSEELNPAKQSLSLIQEGIYSKDFEHTVRVIESEEKILNIVLGILTFLLVNFLPKYQLLPKIIHPYTEITLVTLLLFFSGFTYIIFDYLITRHKVIVLAKRKAALIRKMMKVSYTSYESILPSDAYEGTSEPFKIQYMVPCIYILFPLLALSCAIFIFLNKELNDILFDLSKYPRFILQSLPATYSILYFCYMFIFINVSLLDKYLNLGYMLVNTLSKFFFYRIDKYPRQKLYNAELAVTELKRNEIDTKKIKDIIVFVEDKSFYNHWGISCRGIVRAIYKRIGCGKISGGSTITQQLSRTLFFEEAFNKKIVRRKILEIAAALFWVTPAIPKDLQLDMYIVSVRYEKNVIGLAAAIKYFYGEKKTLSTAQIFFLVERISNINSRFMVRKIQTTVKKLRSEEKIKESDVKEIQETYVKQLTEGRIDCTPEDIEKCFNELLSSPK